MPESCFYPHHFKSAITFARRKDAAAVASDTFVHTFRGPKVALGKRIRASLDGAQCRFAEVAGSGHPRQLPTQIPVIKDFPIFPLKSSMRQTNPKDRLAANVLQSVRVRPQQVVLWDALSCFRPNGRRGIRRQVVAALILHDARCRVRQ
jgi:hypothetical protein